MRYKKRMIIYRTVCLDEILKDGMDLQEAVNILQRQLNEHKQNIDDVVTSKEISISYHDDDYDTYYQITIEFKRLQTDEEFEKWKQAEQDFRSIRLKQLLSER